MKNRKNICVIGSGFSGLSSATYLANQGHNVYVLEKNSKLGGRARQFSSKGFTFDMGPSWYWMPDVFEKYFNDFDKNIEDYLKLKRLDPSYRVFFDDGHIDVPANYQELKDLFESMEEGSGENLDLFISQAEKKYKVGIQNLVYKPGLSIKEFIDKDTITGVFKLDIFKSMHSHIRKYFKNEKIIKLLEFPILFLGATPKNTPALYSLMNFADIKLGTWFPEGGMYKIVEAMVELAKEKGVKFYTSEEVKKFSYVDKKISHVITTKKTYDVDFVVCSADYQHFDQNILEQKYKNYSASYWDKRTLAPSSLLFYIGLDKKLKNISHHCLFFDKDFEKHAEEIYSTPRWPSEPLFYASFTSNSDETVAPKNHENMFLLIPIAPDLEDNRIIRERYFDLIISRLEKLTNQNIKDHIVYKKSYGIRDFKKDYHSFKGNAYGLANTLMQTAILKPSIKNKKLDNLYFCGQLTVPGPGVPPSLISGNVVAKELLDKIN
ncbi:MAG: phytoene desaturase family protein [Bacteroidota bacterium]|nr:phytoene desaturase family protein [Bacteroidota bacterium]